MDNLTCDRRTFAKATALGAAALSAASISSASASEGSGDLVVTTVCGDVAPEELGVTSMHEHTILDAVTGIKRVKSSMNIELPAEKFELVPENYRYILDDNVLFSEEAYFYDSVDGLVGEVEAFQELGGQTIVDASGMGLRGDVALMRELSEKTGAHIVCCTGVYQYISWPDEIMPLTEDEMFDYFMGEIENGIGDTGVKPGFVKHAFMSNSGSPDIYAREVEAFRACVRAAVASGLSLQVHTTADVPHHEDVLGLVDMAIDELGMDPGKLVMLHMPAWTYDGITTTDYAKDPEVVKLVNTRYPLDLLERGVVVSIDGWGNPFTATASLQPDDKDRLKMICTLIDRGYQDQLVLGDDCICPALAGLQGGQYGYTRLLSFAKVQLEALGYGPDVIDALFVKNPARILAH